MASQERTDIVDQLLHAGLENIEKDPEFNKEDYHKVKNGIYKTHGVSKPFQSIELIERYHQLIATGEMREDFVFIKLLRKRWVRSLSGVTVISLLTEFFGCPGQCVYCPSFEGLPKSYIPHEPAVMRAELNKFDPVMQIHNRLRGLEVTGHKIEKNDVRVIWGTWSVYPRKYQEGFIKAIYDAFNSYDDMKKHIEETDLSSDRFAAFKVKQWYKMKASKDLAEAKKINETSRCRVIGMAIETRPDWLDAEEIARLRTYWITRVEIGYQTTDDAINTLNKRGHWNKESIAGTKMLKDAGMKVVAHMMPNLLGSTPDKDRESMQEIFDDQNFRPDELKIYPMVVTDKSELTEIWREGWFTAYDDETLIDLTVDLEKMIPEYVRLNRTYRDIPGEMILEGSKLANLRQIVENKMEAEWIKLFDIRHRELKNKKNKPAWAIMNTMKYEASDGIEYFITFEDPLDRTIFSLTRFRIPSGTPVIHESSEDSIASPMKKHNKSGEVIQDITDVLPELKWASIIREIHTFWDQLSVWEKWGEFGQHVGFWKRLIVEAERLSLEHGLKKIAVIAGVGVRAYYEKRWYHLEWEYMVKYLT